MIEKEIQSDILTKNENDTIDGICKLLSDYNGNICDYIADFVSSLCNVTKDAMFSDSQMVDVAQARGLFFYTYRYATGDTYSKIANTTKETYGKTFSEAGIKMSVGRMSELIEKKTIWNKRWSILKLIIKSQKDEIKEPPIPIVIKIPKNVIATIKQE